MDWDLDARFAPLIERSVERFQAEEREAQERSQRMRELRACRTTDRKRETQAGDGAAA